MSDGAKRHFRQVPGFPGYFVTSCGEVWSLRKGDSAHSKRRWGKTSWRRLKVDVNRYGYERVALMRDGKSRQVTVHVAVCEAFHGPRPTGYVAAHADGNKRNNSANNLRWATQAENVQDAIMHGAKPLGERVHTAKLSNEQAIQIVKRLSMGERGSVLAREFGVTHGVITGIKNGRSWKHLTASIH